MGRSVGIGAILIGAFAVAPAPVQASSDWSLCSTAIPAQERAHEIPSHLLTAISLAESGRWKPEAKRNLAWPWTVMAEGRGRYLDSKETAINEVLMLRRKGVRNIDVGCMQVNLHYHPDAFDSLEAAFDPDRNTEYAAQFLRRLKDQGNSWSRAVGRYHSATPERHHPYRRKVLGIWRAERRAAMAQARAVRAAEPTVTVEERRLTPAERRKLQEDWRARVRAQGEARIAAMAQQHERMLEKHEAFLDRQAQVLEVYRRYLADRRAAASSR